MKTSFQQVVTDDRLILDGLLFEPERKNIKAVLHIHGMAGNFYENRFLMAMAKEYTEASYAFCAGNNRGHDFIADFKIDAPKEEYKRIGNSREQFEDCILDIGAWIVFLKQSGYTDIVLQGHSLGTSKASYYLIQTSDTIISKLVLVSPSDMVGLFEDDVHHKENLTFAKQMIVEGKGDETMPTLLWDWYSLTANTYANFGERGNAIDIFNTYDKEAESMLQELKIPILAVMGSLDDSVVMPHQEALAAIKAKAKNCPRFETSIIEGASHSYFGHEEELATTIRDWLGSR